VQRDDDLIILVGRPETKTWWRNFRDAREADVLIRRRWQPMVGHAVLGAEEPKGGDGAMSSPLTSAALSARLRTVGLRRRWTVAFIAGELAGFVAPSATGAVLAALGAPDPALVAGLGAGGALIGSDIAPVVLLLVVLIPAWTAALLAMGYAQWRVLRRVVPRSRRWVWVTAAAWLLGVIIPVAALSLAPNAWPAVAHAVVGVLAAVAMGATVGGLTGATLERLLTAPA
jgi:hypothetical protein